ncbi:hypothetical protein TraAM80_00953 [Trypanosoma rangeli]|uniref:Uncharacterized protein n=1 Tax=Trypanosoma rangeli TaxID=5698 RepID=A0A3R7M965_TRYRA|nr:uncharacterized protein TraAM80_00953 [Trypanosoma rangeli]RNF11317.1 hypothetical protein TraAM80_00953 [Trypanosoma rangeli]|eukprot:RNF11317.1 hypothetical protein TraAM80_00953 [Trypanosoma rangeli]
MKVVAPRVGPPAKGRCALEGEHARESGKNMGEVEKRSRALERQLRVLLNEREDHLDALEEMQRAARSSQVEVEQLREELRIKVAEVEEVRQRASKEALWLVKSEWYDKLDDLARNNTELFREVNLRDNHIAELQQQVCEFNKVKNKDASLPEKVTVLTAELLRREKLMGEKDAVLYAYEARLERAERATLSALESQCKVETRVCELLRERVEHLRALTSLSARNEELEACLAKDMPCGSGVSDTVVHVSEQPIDMCEETGTDIGQLGKCESLVSLLMFRLAANEAQMQLRSRLLKWVAFALQKKSAELRNSKTGALVFSASSASLRYASEINGSDVCLAEEEVTMLQREAQPCEETREQLQIARNELKVQREEYEWKERAYKEREDNLLKKIETLLQQRTREPTEKVCAASEQSVRPNSSSCTSAEGPLSEAKVNSNSVTPQSLSDAFLTQNELAPGGMSVTEEEKEKAEKALSSAVESLTLLQDKSEINAIITTLLSLHREGLEVWRRKALLAEQRVENWEAAFSTLSVFLQGSILPYVLVLDEMYATAVTDKMNLFAEATCCITGEASTNMYEVRGCALKVSREFIMLKYWGNWRLSLEASRLVRLREKATRTMSSMAEQYEQLGAITQRAMTRIKDLEGSSGDTRTVVAGV